MSEIKLLPCPFCGGEAKLESNGEYAVVGCKNSDCQGNACCYKYNSKKEAVEYWNTRKPMGEIASKVQQVIWDSCSGDEYKYASEEIEKIFSEVYVEEGGIE